MAYRTHESTPFMRQYRKDMSECIRLPECYPVAPQGYDPTHDSSAMMADVAEEKTMGCCKSCDNGGTCDCGGNCDGSCGKEPGYYPQEEAYYQSTGNPNADAYEAVMGGPLYDSVVKNVDLQRNGDFLMVRYRNPGAKGSLVVSVPFAPLMTFCQNLAMVYGRKETRSNTVMGYAPILALITSQLASKKVVDDAAKDKAKKDGTSHEPTPDINNFGPMDLSSLFKMIPGLSSMIGVGYEQAHDFSEVAELLMSKDNEQNESVEGACCESCEHGGSCGEEVAGMSPWRDWYVRHAQASKNPWQNQNIFKVAGEEMSGGCGCGVPCDGIQPNSEYMSPKRVFKRNATFVPYQVERSNRFWNEAPRVNDQANNMFGRSKSSPPSAVPYGGWQNRYYQPMDPPHAEHSDQHFDEGALGGNQPMNQSVKMSGGCGCG